MATTAALPEALRTYLATCSAEHADQIIQTLRESIQRNAPRALPTNAASSMRVATTSKAVKKQRNKKAKREGEGGGPKRPLNSWMAFRKYYNASLSPYTQKAISKVLMAWWRADPFSAKWAIIAKAYSVLRGSREKEDAPLDEYLNIAVPVIGVVPPDQYPQMMGWQVIAPTTGDQEKMPQVVRVYVPNFETFDVRYTTTNLSVDDLVEHCKRAGFVQDGISSSPNECAQGLLTMAVQPAATITSFTSTAGTEPHLTMAENGNATTPLSPWSLDLAKQLQAVMEPKPVKPKGMSVLTQATTAVTKAGAYPYNNLFDPTSEFDVSFNPNEETADLEDGGVFDSYDPTTNMEVEEMLNLDWNQFVNDDGMS